MGPVGAILILLALAAFVFAPGEMNAIPALCLLGLGFAFLMAAAVSGAI